MRRASWTYSWPGWTGRPWPGRRCRSTLPTTRTTTTRAATTSPWTALWTTLWTTLLAGFSVPLPAGGYVADTVLPASLHLHRLDLPWRVQEADEPDLVAALSELIGFDPEDQVFCVAPAAGTGTVRDPEEVALDRAVRRVARVYGLPVLHYRRASGDAGPVGGIGAGLSAAPAV